MRNTAIVTGIVLTLVACSLGREFDTAPSVTGNVSSAMLSAPEYPDFVAKWLGPSTAPVPAEAIARHAFRIEPPNRPGYSRVGGKELDDALAKFGQWCAANGGKPVGYGVARGVDPRLVAAMQQPASALDSGGAYKGCERLSIVIAVIHVDIDGSTTDRPALLTVTHYTQPSIAQAGAAKREAVRSSIVRAQEARGASDKQARARDSEFQKTLKVGDLVHWNREFAAGFAARGLVVEVRPPIALVQFSNVTPSPQWVRIEELGRP